MVCRCYSLHSCSLFQVNVRYLYMLDPSSPHCGANTLLINTLCSAATEVIPQAEHYCFWVRVLICARVPCMSNSLIHLRGVSYMFNEITSLTHPIQVPPSTSTSLQRLTPCVQTRVTSSCHLSATGQQGRLLESTSQPFFKWPIPFPPPSKSPY